MQQKPPVRWGIIGAGDISHRVMAPAMRATECSELVAVMRTTQAGAEEFAHEHGARRAYDNVEALVKDPEVEAVYVSTPVDQHCPNTLAAAAQGKHVLCEKPLALSVAEGEAMRQACRDAAVTFMTCYYQRFSARHRKIREIIQGAASDGSPPSAGTFRGVIPRVRKSGSTIRPVPAEAPSPIWEPTASTSCGSWWERSLPSPPSWTLWWRAMPSRTRPAPS